MELIAVAFDKVKAEMKRVHDEAMDIVRVNEVQVKMIAAHPTFNEEVFPADFDVAGWIEDLEANTPAEDLVEGSPSFEMFAKALTVTGITTGIKIPERYYRMSPEVAEAVKSLVITSSAVNEVNDRLSQGEAPESIIQDGSVAATERMRKDCMQAAIDSMDDKVILAE